MNIVIFFTNFTKPTTVATNPTEAPHLFNI